MHLLRLPNGCVVQESLSLHSLFLVTQLGLYCSAHHVSSILTVGSQKSPFTTVGPYAVCNNGMVPSSADCAMTLVHMAPATTHSLLVATDNVCRFVMECPGAAQAAITLVQPTAPSLSLRAIVNTKFASLNCYKVTRSKH
jgi:hypothetical protein